MDSVSGNAMNEKASCVEFSGLKRAVSRRRGIEFALTATQRCRVGHFWPRLRNKANHFPRHQRALWSSFRKHTSASQHATAVSCFVALMVNKPTAPQAEPQESPLLSLQAPSPPPLQPSHVIFELWEASTSVSPSHAHCI